MYESLTTNTTGEILLLSSNSLHSKPGHLSPVKYFFILLFFPLNLLSQDITGLWSGSLYNDTTQKELHYEVAISESKGKYTAYTCTNFILAGQEVLGIKSIKVIKQKDRFFFEDVELLYNNYPVPPPKGVKQISSVTLTEDAKMLTGKFITTRTRQYGRQVTGTVKLERIQDAQQTKLLAELDKLGLSKTLSFLQPKENSDELLVASNKKLAEQILVEEEKRKVEILRLKTDSIATVEAANKKALAKQTLDAEKKKVEASRLREDSIATVEAAYKRALAKQTLEAEKKKAAIIRLRQDSIAASEAANKKALAKQALETEKKKAAIIRIREDSIAAVEADRKALAKQALEADKKKAEIIRLRQDSIATVEANRKALAKQALEADKKKAETVIAAIEPKKQVDPIAELAKRKVETIQTVYFTSDSLQLTLYDNGFVDGDSVSIIINGQVLLQHQRLTAQPITKTIKTPAGSTDSINLIMYAENLGSIAPNTGLLIIYDGSKRHEITFSGDLQKNSSILLKRKK
ncbi:MAG: hypothetical protein JWQ96_1292 [Segetibacter sp.]|nr:hypothetical protein [Segetibacter sp.]